MSVEEKLRVLAERIKTHSSAMLTEEALKTAIVLPFLSALDYDVFNPDEVIPEFCADAVGKKGEKVDYAIKIDGEIRILIECKPITTTLEKVHLAQLYRYFSVTNAKFAILTNGRTFHFHTDLVAPNKLDERPFLTFDLSDLQGQLTIELKKFAKSEFNVDGILQSAHRLKYTSAIKKEISGVMENPPEDFVRMVTVGLYPGRFTGQVKEQFTPMVKAAFREIVRESVQSRLSNALAETEVSEIGTDAADEEEVVTTEEEREGFMVVRAIVRDILKPVRVIMRDQKSYCGILVDNNNRKPLARLWFNRSVKYLGLFDGEKEEKVKVDTLDEIYEHADRIRATAKLYVAV
ncbi:MULTISPECIES: type I restriction endonuclease [unclassified Mesorhizobium]|uniref:type I restriction endonuclease n=1 Tax=unclassified Mesorhizobium TaxID=325217 RepID=UPI003014B57C